MAILAGGDSTRMGEPKSVLALAGAPLLTYPLGAARAAELEAWVVAKPESELPALDCRVLLEPSEPRHPLCGLAAALREAAPAAVIALAADMPFVEPDLLRWLAAREATTAVEAGGRLQPLLARYEPGDLAALEAALAAGDSATGTLHGLGPRVVGEAELRRFGEPERLCFNVNSPADLERARELLTR